MKDQQVQRLPSPTKSPKDEKEYSVIQLSNGLKTLIVSDVKSPSSSDNVTNIPDSEKPKNHDLVSAALNQLTLNDVNKIIDSEDPKNHPSISAVTEQNSDSSSVSSENTNEGLAGVALTINVGSFSDPAEIPGLAHFVEHMIVLGSEKYPDEDHFTAYLKTKGGNYDACTYNEHTTFYFECLEAHLEEALDIFSQYFICPLLKEDAMSRGWEEVDSHFQYLLLQTPAPLQQFLSSLIPPNHPYSKFRCGNKQTLEENVSADYLHTSTVEFWKRHYSAHRMNLAIQASLPSSLIESWVVKYFSTIPSNNLPPDTFPMAGQPFVKEKYHKWYFVQSRRYGTYLSIDWMLPPMIKHYKERPLEYIAWIIDHEGTNSLTNFLKSKNWASTVLSGVSHDSLLSNFEVDVLLSKSGVTAMEEIAAAVFSFLKMIREQGPSKRIYDEIHSIAEIDFHFPKKQDATSNVVCLSQSMLKYPSEEYVRCSAKYDPELIQSLMDQLIPENACIVIHTNADIDVSIFNKEEFWFKTKYREDKIEPELLEYFNDYKLPNSVSSPAPSDFVPFNFGSVPACESTNQFPVKLDYDSDRFEIWHKQSSTEEPATMVHFHFITDLTNSSARNSALFGTYIHMFKQVIRPAFWPACICGYILALEKTDRGFQLELTGYHQKLHLALELVLAQIKNFHSDVSPELFENVKEEQGEQHRNELESAAEVEASLRYPALLRNYRFLRVDHIAELPNIQFEDLIEFSKQLWRQLRVQCLFQGNLTAAQAKEICDRVGSALAFDVLPLSRFPHVIKCQLPLGKSICQVRSFDATDANCVTTEYYQCGVFDLRLSCIIQLFGVIFKKRLFDTLRTEEQLGYVVSCNCQNTYGILGFWVLLVSPMDNLEPKSVATRLSSFVQNFDEELKSLPEQALKEAQESLIKIKLQGFDSLQDEVTFNFKEIVYQSYAFGEHCEEAKHIRELKLSDLVEWYEKYVKADAEMLRTLVVQVIGHHPDTVYEFSPTEDNDEMPFNYAYIVEPESNSGYNIISDIKEFNRSLQSYEMT